MRIVTRDSLQKLRDLDLSHACDFKKSPAMKRLKFIHDENGDVEEIICECGAELKVVK